MGDDFFTQRDLLRAEIGQHEAEIARLQAEIAEMERELAEFQTRYDRIVGVAQTRLDAIRAAIDDVLEQNRRRYQATYDPQPSWTPPNGYVSVEEQYRRVWQTPARNSAPRRSAAAREPSLKQRYRELARRFHPDLATDPAERQRRTEIMHHINEAYAAHDLETLDAISDAIGEHGDELPPDAPLESLTLRHLQRLLDSLRDEVTTLKHERDMLFYGEMMRLKLDEKLARMRGRDLLRELAQQLNEEFFQLQERLDALRRNGGIM